MVDWTYIIALTFAAGLCMPLGGAIASVENIRPQWLQREFRHFSIAFGGGLLLGAVFSVLLPEGMENFGREPAAVVIFLAGGVIFFLIERTLGLRRREAPQFTGMLLDYIPESIALGGLAAVNPSVALTLAVVIGMQNLPEGFNAYRELSRSGARSLHILGFMCLLTLLGPVAGLSAYYFLSDQQDVLGGIMLMSAGGIMYLMFQDIAPQSRLRHHWAPPLGGVLGFAATLITDLWITGI